MCVPRACCTALAVAFNLGVGVWAATSLNGEYKALSAVFFAPALTEATLCLAPRGSCAARTAGVLVVLIGLCKLLGALALGLLAAAAAGATGALAKLGALAYSILAAFLGLSALADLAAGIPATTARRRARPEEGVGLVRA